MYDWSDIRTFLAVMRDGSAAGAARSLGTNQTTVSRRLARLERALDLTLFEIGPRGALPTANALALLAEAEAMEAAALAVQRQAEGMRRHLSGTIRLTTTPGAPRYISGLLHAFRELHPDVTFELDAGDRAVSLEAGEADVAMRAAHALKGDTLIARKLFDHPWAIYASEDYVAAHGGLGSLADLPRHRVVRYSEAVASRLASTGIVQEEFAAASGHLTVSTVESMVGLLVSGEGMGLLPRSAGDTEPGLTLCFTAPGMAQRFWLVWSQQSEATPHIRTFISYVLAELPQALRALPREWRA